MIKRVAIDPELPATPDRIILLARDLRVARGRYLEVLVGDWRRAVLDHVRRIPDETVRARCEAKLAEILLDGRGTPRRAVGNDRLWIDAALELATELDAIATDRSLPVRNVVSYRDIEDDAAAWHVETTIEVPRSAAAYVRALAPVARVASYAWIVDPYILKNSTTMGRFLVDLAREFGRVVPLSRISLNTMDHAGASQVAGSVAHVLEDLAPYAGELASLARSIEIVVWGATADRGRMHDRFFLTDVGGVGLGNWLDAGARGVASFGLLDDGVWSSLRARFDLDHRDHPNSSPYRVVHRVAVAIDGGGFT